MDFLDGEGKIVSILIPQANFRNPLRKRWANAGLLQGRNARTSTGLLAPPGALSRCRFGKLSSIREHGSMKIGNSPTVITTSLDIALQALRANEIIAIPTETVYGLAGNAYDSAVIEKIFSLKKRPFYNPLIVHIASVAALPEVASEIPALATKLANEFWPGPLTLILKKQPHIPDLVTAGKPTVAVRVPNHPLTLALLAELPFPLAAPSANPFGSISPTTALHVANYFDGELGVVLDGGECQKGLESTIVGFEDDQVVLYRLGAISMEDIEKVVGKMRLHSKNDIDPTAPGMLSRHYSPSTKTILTDDVPAFLRLYKDKKVGLLSFQTVYEAANIESQELLSPSGNLEEAAKNLYAAMHRLDERKLDVIVAERFPDIGLGKTINDRLQRAAEE
jgi:L-threonylcarbamoyladenylate synthase